MSEIITPTPRQIKRYGWKSSIPDIRDKYYKVGRIQKLPTYINLRSKCPAVYNQGNLGSCTANALNAAVEFTLLKEGKPDFIPSRLFTYYNERIIEGTVDDDAGAELKDGMKTLNQQGVCNENLWPYNIDDFCLKPSNAAYTQALTHKIVAYNKLDNASLYPLYHCLAYGTPFVFGFSVYESFESDEVSNTGKVPMPSLTERVLGGHAVMAVGYSDKPGHFIVRNSWGSDWGDGGYFYMPYKYVTNKNLCSDFWMISSVN